ncbi:substrate-binding periplasmic protein [Natronospira bacteriovora]|uniref:Transporter substrate-binding domain-containing protein n=1 Tax=Natronospira bacteriovora TaxID=3069753 RepID=A0ABU0W566_9GAMM|nr:transporter substrate-binding domain-containing protein [Natronospira sp. AB-CW4]MDQ2068908.1 transporter substrate-binding domain-containing protein [Natronospira sp. AB-CW4]
MLKQLSLCIAALSILMSACDQSGSDYADRRDGVDHADRFESVSERGHGRIEVLYVPATGWAYRDDRGELTGVTVEIMRDFKRWLAREQGLDLELLFVTERDWRRFYQRVVDAEGGVFGIGNVTITEERRQELAFSPAYLTNVAVLITHESQAELRAMVDIAGAFEDLSALAFEGTLHEERLQAIRAQYAPELTIESAQSNDAIIDGVAAGDYFAYIDAYNYWRAREAGQPLRHHPVGDDPGEHFGIIMPRGSDWAPVMEAFFQADDGYVQSERYRSLLKRHLGEEVAELLLSAAD